jgi:NAD(P)H-hydrate epimerase
MYLVTNAQMKAIEQKAITAGVPSLLLMENASLEVTDLVLKDGYKSVIVFCGKGNNGGDGLACARGLYARGIAVSVVYVGMPQSATDDNKTNLKALRALDIPILYYNKDIEDIYSLQNYLANTELIIDALVGTGLSSTLREPINTIVELINSSNKPVYSVDCPSGVSTETGEDFNCAVYADKTITFHLPKIGLMLYPAYTHIGELLIGNISLPQNNTTKYRVLTNEDAVRLMPKRVQPSNKGTYGKVYAFVGCDDITGAAVFSLKSAYKIGAGLVYAFTTKHCADIIRTMLPEAVINGCTSLPYIDNADVNTEQANAVLIGCGIGNNDVTYSFLDSMLDKVKAPLILDADALNVISAHPELKNKLPVNTIITPHPLEMSRLTGLSVNEILKNPVNTALDFSKQYKVITVLKDAHTIIATPMGEVTINITGSPAMSKGGSGDCLAGTISGLLAQGLSPYDAACLGCYICGKAGEIAAHEISEYGVLASDIIEYIPIALRA